MLSINRLIPVTAAVAVVGGRRDAVTRSRRDASPASRASIAGFAVVMS
jgi:hypothetical protein